MRGVLISFLFLLSAGLLASSAHAKDVAVDDFKGPRSKMIRKSVVDALKAAGHDIVAPGKAAGRVEGTVSRKGKRWMVKIELQSAEGKSLSSTTFRARRPPQLRRIVRKQVARRLRKGLAKLDSAAPKESDAAPEEKPAPEVASDDGDRDEGDSTSASSSGSATASTSGGVSMTAPRPHGDSRLRVEVGMRMYNRALRYNDDLFGRINEYQAPARPEAVMSVSYVPLSFLEVVARGAYTSEFDSRNSAGDPFPTSGWAAALGARYRWRQLGAGIDFGARNFAIEDAAEQDKPAIPSVDYRYIRLALDGSHALSESLSIVSSLGYRYILSAGEIQSQMYFPRSSAGGIDASASVVYALTGSWSVAGGIDLERYFYTLNPEPGDPWIAGGATDQYVGGWVSAVFRM